MADASPVETNPQAAEAVPKTSSKAKEFVGWLKNFGKKHEKSNPQAPVEDPIQKPETPEAKPPKSVNELLGVKEADQLKHAQTLLFHTAPASNLEKLKTKGLFAQKNDPNLGNNLGYSAFFATEHHLRKTGQPIPLEEVRSATSPDYFLTIWRKNNFTKKDKGGFGRFGFYQPDQEPPPETDLNEYIDAAISGNETYAWFTNLNADLARKMVAQEARMVPAEYFAGSLWLDKQTRDLIIRSMVQAETGIAGAAQIENSLMSVVPAEETAHAMAASIEHALIRNSLMEQIKEMKASPLPNQQLSEDSLLKAMLLRTKVNDRVSALYLDKSINWLIEKLNQQGINTQKLIEENAVKINEFNKNPYGSKPLLSFPDPSNSFNYYGSNAGTHIASEIKDELGIVA